jgi:hypothetical protein
MIFLIKKGNILLVANLLKEEHTFKMSVKADKNIANP